MAPKPNRNFAVFHKALATEGIPPPGLRITQQGQPRRLKFSTLRFRVNTPSVSFSPFLIPPPETDVRIVPYSDVFAEPKLPSVHWVIYRHARSLHLEMERHHQRNRKGDQKKIADREFNMQHESSHLSAYPRQLAQTTTKPVHPVDPQRRRSSSLEALSR